MSQHETTLTGNDDPQFFWHHVFQFIPTVFSKCYGVLIVALLAHLWTTVGLALFFADQFQKIKWIDGAVRPTLLEHLSSADWGFLFRSLFTYLLPSYLFLWSAVCVAYFTVTRISCGYFGGSTLPSQLNATLGGLRSGLFVGLGWILISSILFLLVEAVFPLIVFMLLPIVMVPVLNTVERTNLFVAIKDSLGMNYADPKLGRAHVFFKIAGLGALFYLGEIGFNMLLQILIDIDLYLNLPARWFVQPPFVNAPFTKMYFFNAILKAIFDVVLLALMAIATSAFYFDHSSRILRQSRLQSGDLMAHRQDTL